MRKFQVNIIRGIFVALLLLMLPDCKKEDSLFGITPRPSDYLSAKNFSQLLIEVQYISGFQPTPEALDPLKSFLSARLNKPGGISVTQKAITNAGASYYTAEDIRRLEKANRSHYASGDQVVIYVLFLDADYAGNSGSSKVLGIAYGSSSLAIFEKTIHEYSGALAQPNTNVLESTVSEHELGHILGLVNNGTNMISYHQDAANGKHCDNKNCLMYYVAETTDIVGNLLGNNVPTLDNKCISDLQGNGGR